ncbi:TonB-dependent receptor [Massilia sp. YIM B02763]|uniref:TonB-dependent receptor n=1 Tax=Massilia sp. YIM B02763 TaxID=3050130 RepID=UPI0025B6FC89|nr:TonB-dependent receptor [Massilia sp. YIM B02763]MDN4052955.1 TonB-dependent receptor [Massilia sp. YIM B02763]
MTAISLHETSIARTIRRLFAGGGAVGMALLALPAPAQEAAQTAGARPIQRVEITGSNIRRSEAETASSVITVNRADIERSGKNTVAELLQDLAVNNAGAVPTTFGNGFAAGASGVSLRGLGANSTLVLLNGRRIAPYGLADDGQKQFADLNIIPTDAVDRIEVLKDGASAIYGSDAIAGVVNVILRREFSGNTVRAQQGVTEDGDGHQTNLSFTKGFGSLDQDRYNALFSIEYKRQGEIWYRDRSDRDWIGRVDLRPWGFSAAEGLGGTGAIVPGSGGAGSAINGNVRPVGSTGDFFNRGNLGPGTGFTRTFPGAACPALFSAYPQGDPGGGCLIDASQRYNQAMPKQENISFFARGTWQATPTIEAYSEFNFYTSRANSSTTPSGVSGSVGYPGGPVNNSVVRLGGTHPDNPYFGTPATLRYLAADVGPRESLITSEFVRWVGGVKGTHFGWDWDSAVLFSHNHTNNTQNGYLQRNVAFALLDPSPANVAAASTNPAYAALPPGTFWRIGENAGLNSPELYAALSPEINNAARTKLAQWDVKGSRSFKNFLPADDIGLALGAEWRYQRSELRPTTGTELGNIIGLGYSAYEGSNHAYAVYAEGLLPLPYQIEASAAIRYDHISDVGHSYTPKAGLKWTPVREFALRGTFARGFRAPSPPENGVGGLAAYSTSDDPLRCALGVPGTCDPVSVAVITSPNPNLSPERSRSYTAGIIWDPLPRTSISVDYWKIKRKNEINQEQIDAAIAAGSVARDPSNVSGIPGDPGPITAVLTRYVNSAETQVRGLDIDARYNHRLPADWGNLSFDVKYTHLFEWTRREADGTERDFAGTHGNCDISNCAGTPDNRANFRIGWDRRDWRVSLNANFRGKIDNRLYEGDPECASHFANGADAPNDCELASFTSWDLVARWKPLPQWEIFGSIQNVFDKVAPLDPLTYGATSYNPLDYEGARGRLYTLGARYTF